MKDAAFFVPMAAVLIFLIGTCGGVFTKSGMERCAASCGGRMSKWTEPVWRGERIPEKCECLEAGK